MLLALLAAGSPRQAALGTAVAALGRRSIASWWHLTKDATRITPRHHERLRAAGFDDRGILQITLSAAWFNYINRVADALGVGRE